MKYWFISFRVVAVLTVALHRLGAKNFQRRQNTFDVVDQFLPAQLADSNNVNFDRFIKPNTGLKLLEMLNRLKKAICMNENFLFSHPSSKSELMQ